MTILFLGYSAASMDNNLLTFQGDAVPSSSMFKVYSFFFDILTFEDGEATLP
jgi:hypothetical protein